MDITRKKKREAILAFCEGVTKGYSTPRGSGFCTIERNENAGWYGIAVGLGGGYHKITCHAEMNPKMWDDGQTDFLYCILGLEKQALLEAARRVCNESMADGAVTTQSELGVLSDDFEKALGQLQDVVDQYKD